MSTVSATDSTKPKRTANHSAYLFVDKREEFQGSNLRGEAYEPGAAPHAGDSWLNAYETEQYAKNRPRITYVVWSFYTPIAYYVEQPPPPETPEVPLPGQWYKVGQVFSSRTSRHRYGALRNVPGHMLRLSERRGDTVVECYDCGTVRHFTYVRDAREAYYLHRS